MAWAAIKPSARRSIHSQASHPPALSETMGRFGLNNEQENQAHTNNHWASRYNVRGTDELDNVFSEPVHPISPPKLTNNLQRRNSFYYETNDELIDKSRGEEDDSDHSDDEEIPEQDNVYSDISHNTTGSRSANRSPTVTQNKHLINKTTQTSGGMNRSGSARIHTCPKSAGNEAQSSLVLLAAVSIILFNMYFQKMTSFNEIYDESRFYRDIDLLGNEYGIGGNAILLMQAGLSTIHKRQDTGSFMFVYNNRDKNYNQEKFNTFMNNISDTTSKFLRNKGPLRYTKIEGSALKMRGELINRFQADLDRTGVMLVKDVEAIPSDLAMAFLYYCDEYNPLVKKSAIFFTLNLAACTLEADMKSTHAVIEKCLAQKWSGVPSDSIGSRLTRVVSVVIDLTSAF